MIFFMWSPNHGYSLAWTQRKRSRNRGSKGEMKQKWIEISYVHTRVSTRRPDMENNANRGVPGRIHSRRGKKGRNKKKGEWTYTLPSIYLSYKSTSHWHRPFTLKSPPPPHAAAHSQPSLASLYFTSVINLIDRRRRASHVASSTAFHHGLLYRSYWCKLQW